MLARNWKHQWLPLCLATTARTIRIVGMVMNPIRSNQNLRVFWKPVNLQDCVWENLYRIIMKTILQEKERTHYSTTTWNARRKLEIPMRAAMPCKTQYVRAAAKPAAVLENTWQNMLVLSKLTSPRQSIGRSSFLVSRGSYCSERNKFTQSQNLVHKFIPMPQAMKIPDAEAAAEKEWET